MLTNSILLHVAALGTALSIGCASSGARQPAESGTARAEHAEHGDHGPPGNKQEMMGMCPMKVEGTTAFVSDTSDGVAISFTTSTGDVAELRRRVHHMAEMHDRHHGMMGEGTMGGRNEAAPPGAPAPKNMMVPATATATDVEGGARIVLVPKDPARLAELRQHARDHVGRMSRGECPMMAMKGHAQAGEH